MEKKDFIIGHWTVRPRRLTVERDGESVHIKPKSMAVLECLVVAGGEVVTRDELFQTVWPGAVVSDDTLTQCIVELRKAFGDTARSANVIETIPKTGFRLIPPVASGTIDQAAGLPPAAQHAHRRLIPLAALPLLAVVLVGLLLYWIRLETIPDQSRTFTVEDAPTLAVLPFVDMSPNRDQGHLADGLSEELLNRLGGLSNLMVTGRTSAFYFKGKDYNLDEISEALGAGHVLEGSVRKSGDQLRITAKLIDAANGFQLWADTYERQQQDIFDIEDEIAESVAAALSITLGVGELGLELGGTRNVEAYNEVMLGNASYRQFSSVSVPVAIDHFNRATELDPDYGVAWARLADIHTTARMVVGGELRTNWVTLSGNAIDRALSIAANSPEVIRTAGFRLTHMQRWQEAGHMFTRLESGVAGEGASKSTLLFLVGRGPDALQEIERQRRLDPLSGIAAVYLAHVYLEVGRLDEAVEEIERAWSLGTFRNLVVEQGLIAALTHGDRELIRRWMDRQSEAVPPLYEFNTTMKSLWDNREASLKFLRDRYGQEPKARESILLWAAYFGDYELALSVREDTGFADWHNWAPHFAGARKLPGFKAMVRENGLVDYWREFGWGYYCRPVDDEDFECF